MHFLCLHGGSTNSEIFEIQTGGLRQQLEKKGHRFTYVNGKLDAEVEAELEGVVDGPFHSHYPRGPSPGTGVSEAIEHTYSLISELGPFDAVMGFSQGAALAAAMLIQHDKTNTSTSMLAGRPLFRAAIFICGGMPFDSSGLRYEVPQPDTYLITIPTAHIVGSLDQLYPESLKLHALCEPATALLFDHGWKHMVPFDQRNTEGMLGVIEETVARAMRA